MVWLNPRVDLLDSPMVWLNPSVGLSDGLFDPIIVVLFDSPMVQLTGPMVYVEQF